jgi:IclR family transcriptional regulator, mhp operon transcriptional activator
LKCKNEDEGRLARDSKALKALLKCTRSKGYGMREGGLFPHTKSIAVPIIVDGCVHACISIIWIAPALTMSKGIAQFAQPMQRAAEQIQTAIAKTGAATG